MPNLMAVMKLINLQSLLLLKVSSLVEVEVGSEARAQRVLLMEFSSLWIGHMTES